MRAALLVSLLLAHVAVAADDAPLRCYTPVEVASIAATKDAADRLAANDAARIRALEETVAKRNEGTVAVPWVVVLVVASVLVGGGAAVGGLAASGKLK